MENGVATHDESHFGETMVVQDETCNPSVGDTGVHGLNESKDSQGQLFVEAPEDINSLESPIDLEVDQAVNRVDMSGDSGSFVISGIPNGDHEPENFEEAIGLPSNACNDPVDEIGVSDEYANVRGNTQEELPSESHGLGDSVHDVETVVNLGNDQSLEGEQQLAVEKMTTGLVLKEPVDEIVPADETGNVETNAEEILPMEANRFDGGVLEAELREVSKSVADGDTEPSTDGAEAEGRSDLATGKSENVDSANVSLGEAPVLLDKAEVAKVEQVESDLIRPSHEDEFDELIMNQDGESGELHKPSANLAGEGQDQQSVELMSSSTAQYPSLNETGSEEVEIPSFAEESNSVKADVVEPEAEDSQDSQPQFSDRNIKEGSSGYTVVEEPAFQETQKVENREPEIQSARNVGSSTGSSSNPSLPPQPAGLGSGTLLGPAHRAVQQSRENELRRSQLVEGPMNGEAEENDETRQKLQMIRVKFLRLAHRLGQTPHNVVVAQVLYRLGLAEQLRGRNTTRAGSFSFDTASAIAEQLEATGQEALDFSCTIMVIGKTGVGKSATINSIFDEVKFSTDAFDTGTKSVQDVVGTVQGIKVRVIDTPGLLSSSSDQRHNLKILRSVKHFIKKTPPDIILYLDRLDMQSRDFGDMPLLRTITEIFGPSIWFNAIVVLTHAGSAPPDGPNGIASSYEMFVTQRSHVVQQAIRQAAGDMRLMNPVSLVENHSACRTNRAGQRVLPNGQVWKPHLLLLSFASKILAEANTLLNLQDSPQGRPLATRSRAPPLPFLLSSFLQSRPQVKLPEEQFGDDEDALDEDLDEASDSDEETDYDELPPFKRLTKAQLSKLSRAQKKAYFDELEYREKLFMKKQLREERKRRKLLKKMAASAKDLLNEYNESAEEESGGAASVPVPMPDLALPVSFDSDNPTHRYRFLDSSNQWLVRPVLETHGWDHDVGYEGINVERLFVLKDKVPLSFSGQVTKDKKEANIQMELAGSVKNGEGKATTMGFDMQTVGKDMAYTWRSDIRFCNFRHNKTAAGFSVTLLGDALSAGVKVEDKLIVNKRFRLVMTGGAMTGRGDVAYGGSLEATLRDKDYPLGRMLSTLGLSIMDWHGDLAIGCNMQSQLRIGHASNIIARANLNNRGAGQASVRLSSSEYLQIALIGLAPLLSKLVGYSQQPQFGQ